MLSLPVLPTPGAAMSGPWFLLAIVLTLTLTGVPGGRAQPEVAQQEAAMAAEQLGLDDLLRQAEPLLLLREDLQRLREDQEDRESGKGQDCVGLRVERRTPERFRGNSAAKGRERLGHSASCLSEAQKLPLATPSAGGELTLSWDQIPFPSQLQEYFRGQTFSRKDPVPGRESLFVCDSVNYSLLGMHMPGTVLSTSNTLSHDGLFLSVRQVLLLPSHTPLYTEEN